MKFLSGLFAFALIVCFSTACRKSGSSLPSTPVEQDTLLAWQKITGLTDAEDIWFINPARGFVVGNKTIYSSSDSGKTWTAIPGVSGGVYNLNFLDTQTGAAIGSSDLFITTNGGVQWFKKPKPATSIGTSLVDIQFTSPSTAYIATPDGLYKTVDTGNTWNNVYNNATNGMFFFNDNTGIIYDFTTTSSNIYKTTDGGAHWQSLGYISGHAIGSNIMQFVNTQAGWFVRSDSLFSTINGGATWSGKKSVGSLSNDIHFINNKIGYLATYDEIFKTVDGGQTWTRSCKLARNAIIEIFFLDEKTGWACCADGTIIRLKQ